MVTFLEVRVYFFVAETVDALTYAIHSSCEQQPLRLETIGVDRLSGATDWITLSPKRHRPIGYFSLAGSLKRVSSSLSTMQKAMGAGV